MADMINIGGQFPRLTFQSTAGESVTLPDDIDTPFAVVLFYRGHW